MADWREAFEANERLREVQNLRRNKFRIILERKNPFIVYNEEAFRRRYRLSKNTTRFVIDLIKDELQSVSGRGISPELMVLVTLRYYSKGFYQFENGDIHGVSQSTVSRAIRAVSFAIANQRHRFIQMPSPQSIPEIKQSFFEIDGFPEVIGALDCTHIKIKNPDGANPLIYCNRKGWYSLNVQIVCDAHCRIRNVVARWRGSAHDSRIWQECDLKNRFQNNLFNGILLGDGGYANSSYLLTPCLNPSNGAEMAYNAAHIRTRNTVERTFGQWKNLFRSLQNGMLISLNTAKAAIVAMAVLHNIRKDRDVDEISSDEEIDDQEQHQILPPQAPPANVYGNAFRQNFIRRYF